MTCGPRHHTTMPYVYMLECADGSFYVGSTRCLDARVSEHVVGQGAKYTRSRLPVQLVWAEEMDRIDDAYYLEKQARLNQRWTFIGRRLAQLAVSVVAVVQMLGQRRFSTSLSRPGSVPRFVLLGRGTVK